MRSKRPSFGSGGSAAGVSGFSGSVGRLPKRDEKTMLRLVYRLRRNTVLLPANLSVAGPGNKKQIENKNNDENECADDDMQRFQAEKASLARQVWRRDVAFVVMMTVIGLSHRAASLRRRDRIGTAAHGLCDSWMRDA
jgi:hypothetical protein